MSPSYFMALTTAVIDDFPLAIMMDGS